VCGQDKNADEYPIVDQGRGASQGADEESNLDGLHELNLRVERCRSLLVKVLRDTREGDEIIAVLHARDDLLAQSWRELQSWHLLLVH